MLRALRCIILGAQRQERDCNGTTLRGGASMIPGIENLSWLLGSRTADLDAFQMAVRTLVVLQRDTHHGALGREAFLGQEYGV